jgi:hypothetical protein
MIYEGPPSRMLPALIAAIRRNRDAGMRCMYFNSPAMVAGVRSLLYAAGTDVERELASGALVLVSDNDHLVDGHFVLDRMIDTLETSIVQALADGYAGLFATGDMTWEFGPDRDFAKLVDYELRLEQLFGKHPSLSGICQYHRDLLPRDAVREGLVSHEVLYISATLAQMNPHYVVARAPAERRIAAARPELDAALEGLLAKS